MVDRVIIYQDAVPLEEDLLNTNRNVLIGMGLLMQDIFGTATVVGGLPCVPTAPGSLNVQVGPGRIYALEVVDESAYSSLAADTVDDIVKQGINLASTNLSCPAPGTAGTSINYLIEATYSENDTDDVVLSYYNAANPASPLNGPGGDNAAQPTRRAGFVTLQAKAGIPAATGTQTTPAVDSGYVPLYIVTVPFGLSAIAAGNISVYPGAPFITGAFLTQPLADERYLQLAGGVLTGPVTGTSGIFTSLTVNGASVQNAAVLTSGLVNAAQLGTGIPGSGVFLRGDRAWTQVAFSNLSGSIANGQVPVGAVTQWQASLSIAFSQMAGSIANSQVPAAAVTQWQASLSIAWGQITGVKNADELQGFTASAAASASTVALRDGGGSLFSGYFNQGSAQNENPAISQVMVTSNTDGYLRKAGAGYAFLQMLNAWGGFVPFLQQLMLSGAVTLQADPGGTPANGPAGTIVAYF